MWWNIAFILIFFCTPTLLIVNEEKEYKWTMAQFMIPTTVAWVLLVINYLIIRRKIHQYLKKVKNLHVTLPNYNKLRAYT